MKKAALTVTGTVLGLMLCSAVLAYTISGQVFFDTAKNHAAPCCEVYLYDDISCQGSRIDTVTSQAGGHYSFTVPPGNYSVNALWYFTVCAQCDTTGTECGMQDWSDCASAIVIDTDLERDVVLDIDCRCKQDDP